MCLGSFVSTLRGLTSYFERDAPAAVSGDIDATGHKTLHELLALHFQVQYESSRRGDITWARFGPNLSERNS